MDETNSSSQLLMCRACRLRQFVCWNGCARDLPQVLPGASHCKIRHERAVGRDPHRRDARSN
eukprot:3779496-Pleurochrysis_carterae.AAC.1